MKSVPTVLALRTTSRVLGLAFLFSASLPLAACGGAAASASALPSDPSTRAAGSASTVASTGSAGSASSIEIVESAPVETTLDHPQIKNTDQVWLDMITHAQRSLSLAIFYASSSPGDRLEPILTAIESAAARHVDVRLLFDASFYEKNRQIPDRLAHDPGVQVRLIDIKSRTGGVLHAKYFIVDDEDSYVGSANFDGRALEHIQEIGARVHDKNIARTLDQVFRYDWREAEPLDAAHPAKPSAQDPNAIAPPTSFAARPLALPLPDLPVSMQHDGETTKVLPLISPRKLMPEGYATLDELPRLVTAIDDAKTSIDAQLLTYTIDTDDVAHKFLTLDDALRRAAARGVTVRLLVSDWNLDDNKIESLRELVRNSKVQIGVLTIPPFSKGFIPYARVSHAKYMVVDGRVSWVGSSNWEGSYFTRTRNIGLLIDGANFATELDEIFTDGWKSSYAATFDANKAYTPRNRDHE